MKLAGLFGLVFCLFLGSASATSQLASVDVSFFSEELSISYDESILVDLPRSPKEKDMIVFYKALDQSTYKILLEELLKHQRQFQLNDWLFYDLMKRTVSAIIGSPTSAKVELTCWFLLSKAGFDTRLTYLQDQQFVYVFTEDELFEVPMIKENGKNYANLSSIPQKNQTNRALYMLNFIPNSKGKAFTFYLSQLPLLKSETEKKHFSFKYQGKTYELDIDVDKTSAKVMRQYPFIEEQQYLQVPLSNAIANSLLPKLQKWVAGLSKKETLELLVAFTRSSFQYKEDKEYFGRSKPMIADEVFHYPYSDCEDRSALFFCLVKETLDLPMIIIAFPDHLTVAVSLDEAIGDAIRYQGKDYYICDPTGPVNSTAIGEFPSGYRQAKFEIIGNYK